MRGAVPASLENEIDFLCCRGADIGKPGNCEIFCFIINNCYMKEVKGVEDPVLPLAVI